MYSTRVDNLHLFIIKKSWEKSGDINLQSNRGKQAGCSANHIAAT